MTQSTRVTAHSRAEEMPFGSCVLADGSVKFRLWAPSALKVALVLAAADGAQELTLPMQSQPGGWFSTICDKAHVGSRYQFQINGDLRVPDPASRQQFDDVHGQSIVVDPKQYQWSAKAKSWNGRHWEDAVLYELHVGTFTPEGTFAALEKKLDYLIDLGVTAVELMPVADFPGKRNWGYDGVLLFAPDSTYGTPDQLRHLIDTAHQKGLMMFLDVVYNHFGPEGNYLHVYAKQFFNDKHHTPWGAAINYDADGSDVVRQFYLSNVLYWLKEFHFDGLRFDAVHAIVDESPVHILEQIAQAVADGPGKHRRIHLVLEHEHNNAELLERDAAGKPHFYQAQWNDDVHHALHVMTTGEDTGYYCDYAAGKSACDPVGHLARCLSEGFAYQGDPSPFRQKQHRGQPSKHLPPTAFVSFIQNHDQIGNRAFGDRLSRLTNDAALRAVAAVYLLAPNIPMLYMGEEWGSSTPFMYFCDLGPELAPLVTEGRRKEFAKFAEFQDPQKRDTIPDPVDPQTFERSKLDWSDLQDPKHQEWLAYYKQALHARSTHVMPLMRGLSENGGAIVRQRGGLLIAQWVFNNGGALYMIANLSGKGLASQEIKEFAGTSPIFQTSPGSHPNLKHGKIAPWTVVWTYSNDTA
jgi:maltooligosyltrehalose trehalohydrolase